MLKEKKISKWAKNSRNKSYIFKKEDPLDKNKKLQRFLNKFLLPLLCVFRKGPGGPDTCPFWYSPNCAFKLSNSFRRNALKNQFKIWKNLSKRCTKRILWSFQRYFRKGNNKCGIRECGTKECRINFWQTVFKSQTWIPRFILLFSFHMLCYFRVIHILYFHISRQFKNDFVAISFNTKYALDWKIIF